MSDMIQEYRLRGRENAVIQVEMPKGASVIGVYVKDDEPYVCAFVDSSAEKIKRHFAVISNGGPLPEEPRHYVGTIVVPAHVKHIAYSEPMPVQSFVGHVFTDRKEYPL